MKKKISIVLGVLLVMSILLCGCSNDSLQGGHNSNNQNNGNNSEDNGTESGSGDESKIKTIDEKDFPKYIKRIELTKDNWKDYLELVRKEKTNTQTDEFTGEVVSTETYTYYVLKMKDIGQFTYGIQLGTIIEVVDPQAPQDVKLRFVSDGHYNYLTLEDNSLRTKQYDTDVVYTIDDFECTRITGEIIWLDNIPKEVVRTDEKGREYFFVSGETEINNRCDNCRNKKDEGLNLNAIKDYLN